MSFYFSFFLKYYSYLIYYKNNSSIVEVLVLVALKKKSLPMNYLLYPQACSSEDYEITKNNLHQFG